MPHTPAPWWIEVDEEQTWIDSETQIICTDVSNCDANIIASAPDMLAALNAIVKAWETGEDFWKNEIGKARAAIRKAYGDTQ